MTKSELFKSAHKLAKEILSECSDYRTAFSCALKAIYEGYKMAEKSIEEKLEDLGIEAWERGEMKRYYMNDNGFKAVFGLDVSRYNSGNISGARFNGEGISNAKAYRLMGAAVYYDAIKCGWYRKSNGSVKELDGELMDAIRV